MAERRMFAKTIIDSDAFLDMPVMSQLLYFHLSMRADDDGFINKPKTIMRMIGAKDDDMVSLINRKFIIPFENGVVVIKHWRIHNYIQKDRYKPTKYAEEFAELTVKDNGAYSLGIPSDNQMDTDCIQNGYRMDTQVRLGKDRLGKDSNNKGHYFDEPDLNEAFKDFIEMRKKIKSAMTDRAITLAISNVKKLATVNGSFNKDKAIEIINQSVVNSWKGFYPLKEEPKPQLKQTAFNSFEQRSYDYDSLEKMLLGG